MSLSDSGGIQHIDLIVEEREVTGKDGILKPGQVEMLMMRFSGVPNWAVMRRFGLWSESTVLHGLIRTAHGGI
jgi:hypothetical protein